MHNVYFLPSFCTLRQMHIRKWKLHPTICTPWNAAEAAVQIPKQTNEMVFYDTTVHKAIHVFCFIQIGGLVKEMVHRTRTALQNNSTLFVLSRREKTFIKMIIDCQ